MSEGSFDDYLKAHRGEIEAALGRAVDALEGTLGTKSMAAVRLGVLGGGKRLRPVLLIAAYKACGGKANAAVYDLAASVELIHAYSLMHDDLPCMDDAPLRRGRPTPHTVHGVAATTLAGAVLIPWAAARALASVERLGPNASLQTDTVARSVVGELLGAAGAGGMVGGQALDLLGEEQALAEEELSALHRLKTGALLAASLKMGAIAAGAGAETCGAIEDFGRDVGLAFQVMDDVLDATATEEALGNRPSDAEMKKSTYVLLLGVEGARAHGRRLVDRALSTLDRAAVDAPRLRDLSLFVVERGH